LLAGLLVDTRGERLTPPHAVKKGRRYRYYVSASLITEAGTDRAQGWRLAAREIEGAVITILADALSSPARLLDWFGTSGMSGDQTRKMLARAARLVAALGGSPEQRSPAIRALVEQVIVDDQQSSSRCGAGPLLNRPMSSASDAPSDGAIELTTAVSIKRRGVGTRLVLLDAHNHPARCNPALVKAIARGRAWFDELVTGRARSLQELAKRDGISRRYIRHLVGLAFLSPQLVEAILQGRQPVELTAMRLTRARLAARLGRAAQAYHYVIHKSWRCPSRDYHLGLRVVAHGPGCPRVGLHQCPFRENTPKRAGLRSAHPVSPPHPCAAPRESAGHFARGLAVHWRDGERPET
jgi:hypothetical protein